MQLSDYEHLYKNPSYYNGKIVLRKLSDMTEAEAEETETWITWTERNSMGQVSGFNPEQVRKMLSKHFDLFGLIESGLAIDKTTTPPFQWLGGKIKL